MTSLMVIQTAAHKMAALLPAVYDITDGDTDCCTQDGSALACCVYDITDTVCWAQHGSTRSPVFIASKLTIRT